MSQLVCRESSRHPCLVKGSRQGEAEQKADVLRVIPVHRVNVLCLVGLCESGVGGAGGAGHGTQGPAAAHPAALWADCSCSASLHTTNHVLCLHEQEKGTHEGYLQADVGMCVPAALGEQHMEWSKNVVHSTKAAKQQVLKTLRLVSCCIWPSSWAMWLTWWQTALHQCGAAAAGKQHKTKAHCAGDNRTV